MGFLGVCFEVVKLSPCAFQFLEIFHLMEITSLVHVIVVLEEKNY